MESLTVALWDCGLRGTKKDNGFYILSDDLSRQITRDHDNSAKLDDMDPSEYPYDVYLNGDQYNAWLNSMATAYPNNSQSSSIGSTYEVCIRASVPILDLSVTVR